MITKIRTLEGKKEKSVHKQDALVNEEKRRVKNDKDDDAHRHAHFSSRLSWASSFLFITVEARQGKIVEPGAEPGSDLFGPPSLSALDVANTFHMS